LFIAKQAAHVERSFPPTAAASLIVVCISTARYEFLNPWQLTRKLVAHCGYKLGTAEPPAAKQVTVAPLVLLLWGSRQEVFHYLGSSHFKPSVVRRECSNQSLPRVNTMRHAPLESNGKLEADVAFFVGFIPITCFRVFHIIIVASFSLPSTIPVAVVFHRPIIRASIHGTRFGAFLRESYLYVPAVVEHLFGSFSFREQFWPLCVCLLGVRFLNILPVVI
jgi:hypothetical protein